MGGAHFFAEEVPDAADTAKAEGEVAADAPPQAKQGTINVRVTYNLSADGQLRMQWHVDASKALPAQIAPNLFK